MLPWPARCLQSWPRRLQYRTPCLWRKMSVESKPYYITTPIFYPNADPHIGHLYTLIVADVLARYKRIIEPDQPVQFLAGTDEHGFKIQKAAEAKGLSPRILCEQLSLQFRALAHKANISNSVFTRTTRLEHYTTVEGIWNALKVKGLIYKSSYNGWYSVTDECFYAEKDITTTSHPTTNDLIQISTETGSMVEYTTEENYMFRLSEFQQSLYGHYSDINDTIFPPEYHSIIMKTLGDEPLQDLSVSRPSQRLSWGIPVPGDLEQTVYVWFDALLVYLSGIEYPWAEGIAGHTQGWPVDVQVIGKDILRFHAIYFPAILQALQLPLQRKLLVHAHWTVEQKKMSKSIGNVVDPFKAMEEMGVDVVRYYLTRVGGRFRDDTDWSQGQLKKHYREIQSLLGNFLLRVLSPKISERASSVAPASLLSASLKHKPILILLEATRVLPLKFKQAMDGLEIGQGLDEVIIVLRLANKTFTNVAPWSDSIDAHIAYACRVVSLEALRVAGICLQAFMPSVSAKLLDALFVPAEKRVWAEVEQTNLEQRWGKVHDFETATSVKLF